MNDKPKDSDWTPARIKAAIVATGRTMTDIARSAGLPREAVSVAIKRPWVAAELVIAKAIGVQATDIWPSRYRKQRRAQIAAQATQATSAAEGAYDTSTRCPNCGDRCRPIRSKQVTGTFREATYRCVNPDCEAEFVASIAVERVTRQPLRRAPIPYDPSRPESPRLR